MAELTDKVEHGLNEARTLILGTQVLIGFQYQGAFADAFPRLPPHGQRLSIAALCALLLSFAALTAPVPVHERVERDRVSGIFLRCVKRMIEVALLPFAAAIGIDLYLAGVRCSGPRGAGLVALVGAGSALFLWSGAGARVKRGRSAAMKAHHTERWEPIALKGQIQNILTEARVVLPGAQALLGFQLAIVMMASFDELSALGRGIHMGSLLLTCLSTIVLMTPAAYHRVVEDGADTARFRRLAGRLVLAAMVPLGLAMAGDLFVLTEKVTASRPLAAAMAGAAVLMFAVLWGVYPALCKRPPPPAAPR